MRTVTSSLFIRTRMFSVCQSVVPFSQQVVDNTQASRSYKLREPHDIHAKPSQRDAEE